jgi:hypothetical protein
VVREGVGAGGRNDPSIVCTIILLLYNNIHIIYYYVNNKNIKI